MPGCFDIINIIADHKIIILRSMVKELRFENTRISDAPAQDVVYHCKFVFFFYISCITWTCITRRPNEYRR